MPKFVFGSKSRNNLRGVHPHLVRVAETALDCSSVDFSVIEGLRSLSRQRSLVKSGASKTLKSRHITGHAIDVAPWVSGGIRWDWPLYYRIADAFIRAATIEGVPLRWGGNWRVRDIRDFSGTGKELAKSYTGNFPDGPHFELPREYYK